MTKIESAAQGGEARICMPTFRSFAQECYRAGIYEAQDIIVECDSVDLVPLDISRRLACSEKYLRRLAYHDPFEIVTKVNPGIKPVRLKKDYDLFLAICPFWQDIWYLNAVQGWKDRCRISVCWIDELWAHTVPRLGPWLSLFQKYDHIIVGISGTGKALAEQIGRSCHEMAGGVDTIRFSPIQDAPLRVIDVYSIGRRSEQIHREVLKMADCTKLFYVYDTLHSGDSHTLDDRAHRVMYASAAKRSKLFLVAPGKHDCPEETGAQSDLGLRFFEGSAAGSILVGQEPDCEAYRKQFDWPQAVVKLSPDGSNAMEVISKLLGDPELMKTISFKNVIHSLQRHDWVYRLKEILNIAGLQAMPAMEKRETRIQQLIEKASENA
jgi:spore maturation protein CgeB